MKNGYIWPSRAPKPAKTIRSLWIVEVGKRSIINFAGRYAFSISKTPVKIPNFQPISEVTFDAPAFPDPKVLISLPIIIFEMKN